MSRMTELAQRRDKIGRYAPRWDVTIGDLALGSRKIDNVTVVYDPDGTSEATISTDVALEEYTNAPVTVRFGYDDEVPPYFVGKLQDPNDGWWGETGEHVAWGPYKLLSEQRFLVQVDYRGWSIDEVLNDIVRRGQYRTGQIEIHPGRTFTVQGDAGIFPLETTLKDAADTICSSANWVFIDRPAGRRLAMPTPRAGASGKAKASYELGQYPRGAFRANSTTRNLFARVVVFRRNDTGSLDFPMVDFPVEVESAYKPSPLSAYLMEEFAGEYQDAIREARTTASLLQNGMYDCSFTGIDANPDILLYDTIDTEAVEGRDEGGRTLEYYRSRYKWNVTGQTRLSISKEGANMDVEGTGLRTMWKKMPKVHYPGDRRTNPYVVREPDVTNATWDDQRTFEEVGQLTFEELGR